MKREAIIAELIMHRDLGLASLLHDDQSPFSKGLEKGAVMAYEHALELLQEHIPEDEWA